MSGAGVDALNGAELQLIPLGGLGEFGLNAMVLQWEGHLLLLDAGVMFASAELPGVEKIVPDFDYLRQRRDALRGILLTHGHEDHVGAVGFALDAAPAPVYASRLTLGLLRRRLQERGTRPDLVTLEPGRAVEIGPFRVHPIRVAHSVLDSLALAIETPAGVVLTSGDFKIDSDATPDQRTDVAALHAWGERGVRVLLSDSTGVESSGYTGGEEAVLPAFREVLGRTPGRVLVSCFATSIPRIQAVADLALAAGRDIGFLGRRMADNSDVALELGLLRIPRSRLLPAQDVAAHAPGHTLLFVSGSQGEPLSALSMIARDEQPDVAVAPGDTLVLSARVIPGNERAVSRVISNFYRHGCDVVHPGTARVHVSGHGSQQDLLELLRLTRPQFLVPIHGEYRMLRQHAQLAAASGLIAADAVHVIEDGDVLQVSASAARRQVRVAAGRVLLDRWGGGEVEELVVRDRQKLSSDGVVVPVVVLDKRTGRATAAPEIVMRGVVDADEREALCGEAGRLLLEAVESRPAQERGDAWLTRERVGAELRRFFRRRTRRRPMVIPVVMEV
jgi:ribonuclease J